MVMRMTFSASQQILEELCEHCEEVDSVVHISEVTFLHPNSDYSAIKVSTGSVSDTPSSAILSKSAKVAIVKRERFNNLMLTSSIIDGTAVTESLKYSIRSEKMCSQSSNTDVPEFCYRVTNPKFLAKTIGTLSVSASFYSSSVIRNDITGGYKLGVDRTGQVTRIKSESKGGNIVKYGAWKKNWFREIELENPALAKQMALTESVHRAATGKFLEEFQYKEGFDKPSNRIVTGSVYDNKYSILFDGTNDFVALGDASSYYHFDTEKFDEGVTIAAWVYITQASVSGGYPILSVGRTHNKYFGWRVHITQGMKIGMDMYGLHTDGTSGQSGNHRATTVSQQSMVLNEWMFLTWQFKSSTHTDWEVYLNGEHMPHNHSGNGEIELTYNGDSYFGKLGKTNAAQEKFLNGAISNLGIWDTNLSEGAIRSIYNDGNPLNYQTGSFKYTETGSLKGYWRMEEGTGIAVSESYRGIMNGTLTNGTAFSTNTQNAIGPLPLR